MGLLGFYFSGMPVWIASFCVSVWRNHFLGSILDYIHQKMSPLLPNQWYKTAVRNAFGAIRVRCV